MHCPPGSRWTWRKQKVCSEWREMLAEPHGHVPSHWARMFCRAGEGGVSLLKKYFFFFVHIFKIWSDQLSCLFGSCVFCKCFWELFGSTVFHDSSGDVPTVPESLCALKQQVLGCGRDPALLLQGSVASFFFFFFFGSGSLYKVLFW